MLRTGTFGTFSICLVGCTPLYSHVLTHPFSRLMSVRRSTSNPTAPVAAQSPTNHQPPTKGICGSRRGTFIQLTSVATPAAYCDRLNLDGPEPLPFIHDCYHLPPHAVFFEGLWWLETFQSTRSIDRWLQIVEHYSKSIQ